MLGNNHSTTSTPMSDVAGNIFIIGKNHFGKSHCSIGTFIKSTNSTHNQISLEVKQLRSIPNLHLYCTTTRQECQVFFNFCKLSRYQNFSVYQNTSTSKEHSIVLQFQLHIYKECQEYLFRHIQFCIYP